jgi:hypothetical protein
VQGLAEDGVVVGVDQPEPAGFGHQVRQLLGGARVGAVLARVDLEQAQQAVAERVQGADEGADGQGEGAERQGQDGG